MTDEIGMEDGHVWGSILAGVVIGALVGGALALLFAPKRGTELRTDLTGAVDDLKDRAEQVIDDLQASASDLVTRSRDVLDRTRENIARSVEAGKEAYVQKKDELTSQLES
jgi:gas vesicle protein